MRLKTELNHMKYTFRHIANYVNFKILQLRLQKTWRNKLLINFPLLVQTRLKWKVKYIRHKSSFENLVDSLIHLTLWFLLSHWVAWVQGSIGVSSLHTVTCVTWQNCYYRWLFRLPPFLFTALIYSSRPCLQQSMLWHWSTAWWPTTAGPNDPTPIANMGVT